MTIKCSSVYGRTCTGIIGKNILTYLPQMTEIAYFKSKIFAIITEENQELTHSYIFFKCIGITLVTVPSLSLLKYGDKIKIDAEKSEISLIEENLLNKRPQIFTTLLDPKFDETPYPIGLWRTEGLLLNGVNCFTNIYHNVLSDKPDTIVRLFDFDGDKAPLAYSMPDYLKYEQIIELLRASNILRILIPNVNSTRDIIEIKQKFESKKTIKHRLSFGAMIESKEAFLAKTAIYKEVDFICIGLNGLFRETKDKNEVLNMALSIISDAKELGIPCNACGELLTDKNFLSSISCCGVDGLCVAPYDIPFIESFLNTGSAASQLSFI